MYIYTQTIYTEYFSFVHHTTSILAKLSTWCIEHSVEINCSLLVSLSHTDESREGRTRPHIYIYIYTHAHTYTHTHIHTHTHTHTHTYTHIHTHTYTHIYTHDNQIAHHNPRFNLFIPHNKSFDNQGSKINKNDTYTYIIHITHTLQIYIIQISYIYLSYIIYIIYRHIYMAYTDVDIFMVTIIL